MKYVTRHHVWVFLTSAILTLSLTSVAHPSGTNKESLQLRGIVKEGHLVLASFSTNATASSWKQVGEQVTPDCVIVAIDVVNWQATLKNVNGEMLILSMKGNSGSAAVNEPAFFDKEWINSDKNPMRMRPTPLGQADHEKWATLTSAEKQQIYDWYLKHGWILSVSQAGDSMEFAYRNVFTEQRRAESRELINSFVATLNPSQRAYFDSKHKVRPFGPAAPTEGANLSRDDFIASLSSEQRKKYELISPTKK
ncbi:MAG: hypothetical protein PSV13_09065 [Lacunisphaera sp.]|nr:hypothetical protein [Lacunisphaera sp.]